MGQEKNPSFPDRMTGGSRGTPPGTRTEHLVVQHNGNIRSGEGKGGFGVVREVTSVARG